MSYLLDLNLKTQGRLLNTFFERSLGDVERAQHRILLRIMQRASGSSFARDHSLERVGAVDAFRASVPLQTYDTLSPYIDRVVAGERDVLTAGAVEQFALTSGTTGTPKYIPVTAQWRASLSVLNRLWLTRARADNPGCFQHGILMIVGAAAERTTSQGQPCGALSGVFYDRLPGAALNNFVVPYAVAHVRDAQTRYFLTARYAAAQRVSAIGTANPSTLLRLAQIIAENGETLLRAIHDGTLGVGSAGTYQNGGPCGDARRVTRAVHARPPPRA